MMASAAAAASASTVVQLDFVVRRKALVVSPTVFVLIVRSVLLNSISLPIQVLGGLGVWGFCGGERHTGHRAVVIVVVFGLVPAQGIVVGNYHAALLLGLSFPLLCLFLVWLVLCEVFLGEVCGEGHSYWVFVAEGERERERLCLMKKKLFLSPHDDIESSRGKGQTASSSPQPAQVTPTADRCRVRCMRVLARDCADWGCCQDACATRHPPPPH